MAVTEQQVERWEAAQTKEEDYWRRDGVIASQVERVTDRYKPVIDKLAAEFPVDAALLDIGCGPTCAGRMFPFRTKVFLDPLMDAYREIYADTLPDAELICARAEEVPKEDGSFDVVMSVNSLDHMVDPDSVLSEVNRVMKPDGAFLLGLFLHSPFIATLRRGVDRFLPFVREDAHPYHYTRATARELLERHFRIEREVMVFRRDDALVPSFHREDRMFICRKQAWKPVAG